MQGWKDLFVFAALEFSNKSVTSEYLKKQDARSTSAQQNKWQGTRSTAPSLRAMHRRFLTKISAFFPQKMCLELAEALQIDSEPWNFS